MRDPRIRVTTLACVAVTALALLATSASAQEPDAELLERARAILAETPLVDGHNDLPWELREKAGGRLDSLDLTVRHSPDTLDTDLVRLREGMVGAQFFADYVPSDSAAHGARFALAQAALIRRLVDRFPETFRFATTADEIEAAHEEGRIAALIGLEGGHAIEGSLDVLRSLHELGVRYITLTHSKTHDWADSATDEPRHDGLSSFGELVVREMNRLGVMVDLSHVSESTMVDAFEVTRAPVIFSHSSTRALTDHPRNVSDTVLSRLRENRGIIMITFVPRFVSEDVRLWETARDSLVSRLRAALPDSVAFRAAMRDSMAARGEAPVATLSDVADHIDHAVEIAGIDHVGLGSDYDGIDHAPQGLEDVSTFPALLAELLRRGYSEEDVAKIVGRNALRVMRDVETAAERLQASEEPVVATITSSEQPDLSGTWKLREGEPLPAGERPRGPRGGNPGGPAGAAPGEMRERQGDPEGPEGPPGSGVARTLTIAQSGFTVTLTTESGRSETYFTDGREERRRDAVIGPHVARAWWDDGDLLIERRGENRTVTQTYRFDYRGPRLIVLTEIRGEEGAIRINRVYDRAS